MAPKVVPGLDTNDRLAISQQILDEYKIAELQPGDLTADIVMGVWEVARGTALDRLHKFVEEGKMEKMKYKTEGTKRNAWLFRPILK